MFALAPKRPPEEVSDVCLLAEGCYPHVAGGVSTWVDWLMRSCPETSFSAVSIVTSLDDRRPRYDFPDNLVSISELVVDDRRSEVGWRYGAPSQSAEGLASIICRFILEGSLDDFASIVRIANDGDAPLSLARLTDSAFAWQLCVASYRILMPQASFKGFFWAWQALTGGLFAVVKADIPRARTYHALSTGYAGLLAARARIEGAEQVLLTEHGIYTNERQIEILTADWITDTIDKGLAGHQDRLDLRDLWTVTFRSFARACYAACDRIITLFDGNQAMQRELGVPTHKLSIIPNGIDVDRFDAIPLLPDDALPAVALIGRVVPIKDVETFLRAAALVHAELPDARFIVAGSAEETPLYAANCRKTAGQLGLDDAGIFTGRIEIATLLSQCHVVALTSVSEGQPLSILEAGAAGLPCVATNVGACRELLHGTGRDGDVQPGGFVADPMDSVAIAGHIVRLLRDSDLRQRLGSNLKRRVTSHYRAADVAAAYRNLYARVE